MSNDPHSRQKTPITGSTNETTGILNVVLFYAVFSAIYILVSDWLVQSIFQDPELITKVSIAKGWGFVLITSASLYTLIRRLLRQSIEQLKVSEEAYRKLIEDSPAIIYQANIDDISKTTYISPRIHSLGYTAEEWLAAPDIWTQNIHPEDLPRVLLELDHAHKQNAKFVSEYRLKTKHGEWRHFRDEASVFVDGNNQPQYLQGMMIDITDHVNAAHELRVAATAFESQDAMFISDENQIILKVNNAFTQITGFSADEAVGKTPAILKSGRQDAVFYQSMWDSLSQSHYWFGEIWNRRKNGEVYPEWLSISAVLDENKRISNYVASFSDITQRKKAEETIHHLSYYDALTGLPNRRMLLEQLNQLTLGNLEHKHSYAILHIGIDDFKKLNDTRGHDIGDLLLKEMARRIKTNLQSEDTVARVGGDEFIVLLDTLSSDAAEIAMLTLHIANRLKTAIQQSVNLLGIEHQFTASIGITIFQDNDTTPEELLKRADAAMYQAKQSGRNQTHFFDPSIQRALEDRVLLETMLRKAIPDELELYYQMQIGQEMKFTGVEALIRWQHPKRGMISPADFIPLAEETGLIIPIGQWVLHTACKQLKSWEQNPMTRNLSIAVNVSAKQMDQADFVDVILSTLNQTGADPSLLKLELTESLLVGEVESIIEKMSALKSRGVHFSLDDFGTGYSSLAYLKKLPIDQLKIDQSFVRDVLTDTNDAAIVRTIIALGQSLGFGVIAEGVETAEQQAFLAANGCHDYQGYFYNKPMPIQALEDFFKLN